MVIRATYRRRTRPVMPRLSSGRGLRLRHPHVYQPTPISRIIPGDSLIVRTYQRDPNWNGWSFESHIVFDEPVDELELLEKRVGSRMFA